MKEPLLNCADVAKWLNCSLATLSRLVKANGIPHVRLCGGIRFDQEQVKAWIVAGGHQPTRRRGRPRMVDSAATQAKNISNGVNLKDAHRFTKPVEGDF
jgi:excisionase family DNA binding protein